MTKELNVVAVSPSQSRLNDTISSLKQMGHSVVGQAGDPHGARPIIDGFRPGLVVVDHDPPALHGPDAVRTILRGQRLPVLVLHRQKDGVSELVSAIYKAGASNTIYWDGVGAALETGIAHTVECFHQRLELLEMSAAAKLIVEAGRDIVVKRERLNRSQALAQLRRECRRRNLNLVDYAYQVIFGRQRMSM